MEKTGSKEKAGFIKGRISCSCYFEMPEKAELGLRSNHALEFAWKYSLPVGILEYVVMIISIKLANLRVFLHQLLASDWRSA